MEEEARRFMSAQAQDFSLERLREHKDDDDHVSLPVVPLSSIVEFCVKQTKTHADLDVYRKMIDAQSSVLDENNDADAITVVIINVIKLLPGYEDVIKSLHRYKQDITFGNPLSVMVDEAPVYLSWNHEGGLSISLKWDQHRNPCVTFGREQIVSTRDAMFTFPKRVTDFARAMHKQNINLDKEVRYAMKK